MKKTIKRICTLLVGALVVLGTASCERIDAEAEYNRKISASLSGLIVQQNMIEKWNGELPTYGEVPTLFKSVANGK